MLKTFFNDKDMLGYEYEKADTIYLSKMWLLFS